MLLRNIRKVFDFTAHILLKINLVSIEIKKGKYYFKNYLMDSQIINYEICFFHSIHYEKRIQMI
jgi:hypothetical protein